MTYDIAQPSLNNTVSDVTINQGNITVQCMWSVSGIDFACATTLKGNTNDTV